MQRILNQEPSGVLVEKDRTFYGGKSFHSPNRKVGPKKFYFTETVRPRAFGTKAYGGSKNYVSRNSRYPTAAASTRPKYQTLNPDKSAGANEAPTKESADSDKGYRTAGYETRDFRGRGTAQGSLDKEFKNRPEMTIDQVREILNKNK